MRVQQHRYPVLRKLAGGGSVGLTADIEVPESAIDRGQMAVLAVISTDHEDRSRDVVTTHGIDLEWHRKNPVVLVEHGEYHPYPIAKSEGPGGEYGVRLYDGYATGRAYFSQSCPVAEQMFGLVAEGILRGASIGFRPLEAEKRHAYDEGGYRDEKARGLLIKRCELLEWSVTGIPDQPRALVAATEIFHKNRLNGRPLLGVVKKSLARYATPLRRNQAVGGWQPVAKSHAPAPAPPDPSWPALVSRAMLLVAARDAERGEGPLGEKCLAVLDALKGMQDDPNQGAFAGPSDPLFKAYHAHLKGWSRLRTTRGGNKWKNDETGAERYFPQNTDPNRGKERTNKEGVAKRKEEKQKVTAEAAREHMAGIFGDGDVPPDAAEKTHALLGGMYRDEVRKLAREFGQKLTGDKADLVKRVAQAAVQKAREGGWRRAPSTMDDLHDNYERLRQRRVASEPAPAAPAPAPGDDRWARAEAVEAANPKDPDPADDPAPERPLPLGAGRWGDGQDELPARPAPRPKLERKPVLSTRRIFGNALGGAAIRAARATSNLQRRLGLKSYRPPVGDDYGSQSLMALLALARHLGGPDDDAARRAMALVAEGLDGGPDVAGLSGPSDPVLKSWAIRKAWANVGSAGTTPAGTQKYKWRDDQTGEVRRQVNAPKGASTRQKPAGKGKAGEGAPEKGKEEKQAPAPAKGRAGKADAAEARKGAEEAILAHLADPKGIDADALSSVAEKLQAMHGDDLRALASSMKQAVSGAKLAVAGRIAAAMLARAKGDPEAGKAKPKGKGKAKAEKKELEKAAEPEPGKAYNMPVAQLAVDPGRFQYKLNTNRDGVTDEFRDVKQFNPDFAGVISVWKDPADGKTYVVNGHHRVELARRTGHPDLAVRYVAAGDHRKARALGALINIAEGRGTPLDAAKFMRDTGTTPDALAGYGVSFEGRVAKDAVALTALNDRLFNQVVHGTMPEARALAIGRALPDHDLQDQLVALLKKEEGRTGRDFPPAVVAEMAAEVASTPTTTTTERTLFGDETREESLFTQRAELKAFVRSELAKAEADFAAVASQRRASRVSGAGNVLNTAENRRLATESGQIKNTFAAMVNYRGPISDAINAAAAEYAKARTQRERDAVKRKVGEQVRGLAAEQLASPTVGGGNEGAGAAGPVGGRGQPQAGPVADAQNAGRSADVPTRVAGPKEGDRDESGLVFSRGRWRREGEQAAPAQPAPEPAPPAPEAKPAAGKAPVHAGLLGALGGGEATLADLHAKLGGSLSPGEFQDAVRDLADAGAVELLPFTRPGHEMRGSHLAVPYEGGVAHAVRATGKPAPDAGPHAPAPAEAASTVSSLVAAWKKKNPAHSMPLDALYEQANAAHPMSPGAFHDLLRGMAKRGEIRAVPFTRPHHELRAPRMAFVADQETKFYATPGPNAPAEGAPPPAAAPKGEDPGFTGEDAQGRQWVGGKLQRRQEAPAPAPAAPAQGPDAPEADSPAHHELLRVMDDIGLEIDPLRGLGRLDSFDRQALANDLPAARARAAAQGRDPSGIDWLASQLPAPQARRPAPAPLPPAPGKDRAPAKPKAEAARPAPEYDGPTEMPEGFALARVTPGGIPIAENPSSQSYTAHTALPATRESVRDLSRGLTRALDQMGKMVEGEWGLAPLSLVVRLVRRDHPDASLKQIYSALMHLHGRGVELHTSNSNPTKLRDAEGGEWPEGATVPEEAGIFRNGNFNYFVGLKEGRTAADVVNSAISPPPATAAKSYARPDDPLAWRRRLRAT